MTRKNLWLAAGVRTPFAKVDGPLAKRDAIGLSVPVVQAMCGQLKGGDKPDLVVWGAVAPSLRWSNIAREVTLDAEVGAEIPAFTTTLACGTSMAGVFAAAATVEPRGGLALVGGSESMSGIQIGLNQKLSTWLRLFLQAKNLAQRAETLGALPLHDVRLHIPSITNRTTGLSMGDGAEIMAKTWHIPRNAQDKLALDSHQRAIAGWEKGFFNDLIIPLDGVTKDLIPRPDTSAAKLARLKPSFDTSGQGTLTAGNPSPLMDGAGRTLAGGGRGAEPPAVASAAGAAGGLGNRRRGYSPRRLADGAGGGDPAAVGAQRADL